jgi:hypothetical protein
MVARRELFPQPLSWQSSATPPAWEADKPAEPPPSGWRETLKSPQTKVFVALGIGMVLGWIIKRNR